MTVYHTFVSLWDVAAGIVLPLRVLSWEEGEWDWRGTERRAFDGTLLSTQHTPKRQYRATVEFLTGTETEAFLGFIMSADPLTGPQAVPRRLSLLGTSEDGFERATQVAKTVIVHVTSLKPWFYLQPATAGSANEMKTGYIADLSMQQV